MKIKLKIIFIFLLLMLPFKAFAISDSYVDKISDIVNVKEEKNKINFYLFYGAECPHCEQEREWLEEIKDKYDDYINIYEFEVWHNKDNSELMKSVGKVFDIKPDGGPFTIIGDSYYTGFSDAIASRMEGKINEYSGKSGNLNQVKIPILGKVNMKKVSIPLVAVILGFIDGFNPCAMWILLFLINMLFGMKNKKKMWILGFTFLFVSGFVYFLSMLGIDLILGIATIKYLKLAIALFIIVAGIINFNKYLKIRKENAGCTVVDDKKRKKLLKKTKSIVNNKYFILSLLGIIVLAASVNLIELACSLGFPVIFTELLTINKVTGLIKIVYLLIYIFFYMIDDLFVFIVSMITLEATGITNKYNKLCTLISSIIMILMGLLLIFKQDWLMLNF